MGKMQQHTAMYMQHTCNTRCNTPDADLGLVGYIVKERLFNFFLNLGCVPLTDDHALTERIATSNGWRRPIVVYGYDDTIALAGDLFEAERHFFLERADAVASRQIQGVATKERSAITYRR